MPQEFDYIIIGSGLAGLQLALGFSEDPYFKNSKIALIDPSKKETDDKTWCFWEKGKGKWDSIITKSWNSGKFLSSFSDLELRLQPYSYKMLKSIDFYNYTKNILKKNSNFSFIKDEIKDIDEVNLVAIGNTDTYKAEHFFDSRISSAFLEDTKSTKIFQHFKGLKIKTVKPVFDVSSFTMMDFRIKHPESTSFTYILPTSPTEALIEYTFFTPFLTEEAIYDEYLEAYIKNVLKLNEYEIVETEKGVIPMTDYAFHKESSLNITKIGTAGSWVKGSTGYSFKHTEKMVTKIISNLKHGEKPDQSLLNLRARWYDAIFLDVLARRNDLGENLFSKFYENNSVQEIFEYLDEETSLDQEIKIMLSIYHPEFLNSFFRKLF